MRMLFVPGAIGMREHCFDRIEPLTKHTQNPVVRPDRPWETLGTEAPCVVYSQAKRLFEMWYIASNTGPFDRHPKVTLVDNWSPSGRWFICYACSEDGLHWVKPALGIVASADYPDNNIVMADSGLFLNTASIVLDPEDPDPGRRYKMLMFDHDGERQDGVRSAVSPDGIHWQFVGAFPILPCQDTPHLWHDRQNSLYVAFLKTRLDNRRARMVAVSADFGSWSDPTPLLAPDMADSPALHLYDMSVFRHCGQNLGFLGRLEQSTQKVDVELIASPRGGADWRRLPTRPVVLAPGNPGAWDGWLVRPGAGEPIVVGNQCWYYYTGNVAHHERDWEGPYCAGLATFTYGRIVGQQIENEGWFTSAPFRCPGGELAVDAVTDEPLAVEVVGPSYGGVFKGYAAEQCQPLRGDSPSHAVRWQEHGTLDEFAGRFVALRFRGKNAVVYGARFGEA